MTGDVVFMVALLAVLTAIAWPLGRWIWRELHRGPIERGLSAALEQGPGEHRYMHVERPRTEI